MTSNQQKVVSALRKHFHLTRKQLDPIVNKSLAQSNNIFFDLSAFDGAELDNIKNYQFYVSAEKEAKISNLWNYNKLINTSVYANYIDIKNNVAGDLIFCFVLGDPFVMCESDVYGGLGGVFCRPSWSNVGLSIEPLQNYLMYNFETWQEDCAD